MIDSHCHLNSSFYGGKQERHEMLLRARAAGVTKMIVIGSGSGIQGASEMVALAKHHRDIYACVGCHPLEVASWSYQTQECYWALLASEKVVAVGETGLDFFRETASQELQERVFYEQFLWAKEKSMPLIIHDRASHGKVIALLKKWKAFDTIKVLFHCFGGTVADLEVIVQHGGYISISGIVTFRKAFELQKVAGIVPINRLLIETDSPFLTPKPHRGKRNEPMYLKHTAQKIAELRNCSLEEVIYSSTQNSLRFFGV